MNPTWEYVNLSHNRLTPRNSALIFSINDEEIMILGGFKQYFKGDAYIYNTKRNCINHLFENEKLTFQSYDNQCCWTERGEIAALVTVKKEIKGHKVCLITYKKGDQEVKVIQNFGDS